MLDVNAIDEYGEFYRREITPEQFAVYEQQIENDPESYDNKLEKYKTIKKARETAHNAGLPFREAFADNESEENFNPYAFDGTMSPEDYELMHKLMREDSFEIYQVKSGDEYRSLDTAISEAQTALNKQYDEFSEKYGLISSAENKSFFKNDNSYHLIKALEKLDKDGNFIGKADIFSKITVNPKTVVDHCDNAQDALILSLSEKMCVNLDYMSILTGKSEEELIDELGDKIFQNPQKHMRWESADEYLTGNIRQKLAAAEAEGLTRNAEALRAVMPKRIEAADIAVKLGSAWVDPDYIRQFIVETLQPDFITSKNIEVTYMPATDKWKVEG